MPLSTPAGVAVQTLFKQHFGYTPPHIVKAPGRLEVLGNHTDYNDGLVMSVAVDKYIFIACAPRTDGKIELVSSAFPEPEKFWVTEFKSNPAARWADYVKGVLAQLRKRGVHFSGFNAAIHGTIPVGAGMSSSAALEIATALAVRKLYPFSLTATGATVPPKRNERGELPPLPPGERMPLAKLCHAAEYEFVGVRCGLLDQISSLFGKAWNIINLDCHFLSVEHTPLVGQAVIVCNTGVKHSLVGGEYNALRDHCEAAAKKLGAKSLRAVEMKHLQANQAQLAPREFECAHHIVSEIARVVAAERALRADDYRQFGQYLFQSHESSRNSLKNSCPELDVLVEVARLHPGCIGARLTGGGFGGATINLVAYHQAESFMEHIAREYVVKTGIKITPQVCQIVDGAG
ncbi:MAG: galactokinase [Verrucomicrobia bacterium]|nr:galactokinase [Verrucomicrobiota bacterium]